MLKNIQIQKYKRIADQVLDLENLTKTNYLVGQNGSGKISILDYLYENGPLKTTLLKDSFTSVEFLDIVDFEQTCDTSKEISEKWKTIFWDLLNNKNVIILDLLGYSLTLTQTKSAWNILDKETMENSLKALEDIEGNIAMKDVSFSPSTSLESEQLNAGESKLFNIIYSIYYSKKFKKTSTFLINEPEIHLHPSWQKRIPYVFDYLSKRLNVQFFVATHSPFIISSSGEITEKEKDSQDKPDNLPSQKVYFLKDGRVASKRGRISNKGKNGYWGSKVSQIASTMLGAGLMDLVSTQEALITKDSPILVLCEGEGQKEDSRIYNQIFERRNPKVLFVSSRGSSQVRRTFQILKDIKPGLSADFNMLMVRDRDHEFPTEKSLLRYENVNKQTKVLRKRALECYIYNSETANLLLKKFKKTLTTSNRGKMDALQNQIKEETELAIVGNSYKRRLEDMFRKITYSLCDAYLKSRKDLTLPEKISFLITPNTVTYKELENNIFN